MSTETNMNLSGCACDPDVNYWCSFHAQERSIYRLLATQLESQASILARITGEREELRVALERLSSTLIGLRSNPKRYTKDCVDSYVDFSVRLIDRALAREKLVDRREHCGRQMRYDAIENGDVFDGQQLTGTYYCEQCSTMQPTYAAALNPTGERKPCLEYEWGCANYGSDRSKWCSNCQARVTTSERKGGGQ